MTEVVCALIESSDGRLLACQRAADGSLGGYWEFPGGKVEAGETKPDALKREIREELDAEVEVGQAMIPVEWSEGEISIRLSPYRCRLITGEPRPHEHQEIRWCMATQLRDLNWAPADLPILAEWLAEDRNA